MSSLQNSNPYRGSGSISREQFLFYEMRITARLMMKELSDDEIIEQVVSENLFQYPTERSIRRMVKACLRRLYSMDDRSLIQGIAEQPSDAAKQICLYAMMKQYRIMWDFMITVIGEKYRLQDFSFGQMDLNLFFIRLQEQDEYVESWSDSTIKKIKQVIMRVLIENEYLTDRKAANINPVWLYPMLENAIRSNNDDMALIAFNCLS